MSKRSTKNYSLRTFFFAITAVAVFGWYLRLPKTIDVTVDAHPNYTKAIGMASLWGAWANPLPKRTETQTFRRTNFIHYVRDGKTIVKDESGRVIQVQLWDGGEQVACEYRFRDTDGNIVSEGRTIRGRPHGKWHWYSANETARIPRDYLVTGPDAPVWLLDTFPVEIDGRDIRFGWNRWKRVLVAERHLKKPLDEVRQIISSAQSSKNSRTPTHVFEYQKGELVSVDGKPVQDFFWRFPSDAFRELLDSITVCNLSHRGRFAEMMSVLFQTAPIAIKTSEESRVACMMHGAPLPHSANLFLTLYRNGLVLDYRFGHVFIVHAEDAAEWKDTTGVASLGTGNAAVDKVLNMYVTSMSSIFSNSVKLPTFRTATKTVDRSTLEAKLDIFCQMIALQDSRSEIVFKFDPPELGRRKPNDPASGPPAFILSDMCTVRDAVGLMLSECGLKCESVGETVLITGAGDGITK